MLGRACVVLLVGLRWIPTTTCMSNILKFKIELMLEIVFNNVMEYVSVCDGFTAICSCRRLP